MNFDNSPQTLRYGEKVFTTGGIFTTSSENCNERCGIILELGEDSGPHSDVRLWYSKYSGPAVGGPDAGNFGNAR